MGTRSRRLRTRYRVDSGGPPGLSATRHRSTWGDIDVVVAGGEVAWVTPHQIATWRRLGFAVIGIHPPGDAPAASLLELGGASEVLPDNVDVVALVQAIRFVAPLEQSVVSGDRGRVTAVVGARGAPGCTEVACAYAVTQAGRFKTLLIDADLTGPALAVRLGVTPRPDITDAARHGEVGGHLRPVVREERWTS